MATSAAAAGSGGWGAAGVAVAGGVGAHLVDVAAVAPAGHQHGAAGALGVGVVDAAPGGGQRVAVGAGQVGEVDRALGGVVVHLAAVEDLVAAGGPPLGGFGALLGGVAAGLDA